MINGLHRLRPYGRLGEVFGGRVRALCGQLGKVHEEGVDSTLKALSYVYPSSILRLSYVCPTLLIRCMFYINIAGIRFISCLFLNKFSRLSRLVVVFTSG